MLKRGFKVLAILFFMLCFALESMVCRFFRVACSRSSGQRRLQRYSRIGLKVLGVQVRLGGSENIFGGPSSKGRLIVGNHLSYMDILILASRFPLSFVTSYEIKETPVLGQLCELAGCLFVERRRRDNRSRELIEITDALMEGSDVVIFPEATSTNGEQVLQFRKPMFETAQRAETQVIPFCLNYRSLDKNPISFLTRDHIFWYGSMPFLPHLWSLAKYSQVDVKLEILEPVAQLGELDLQTIADESFARVLSRFIPVRDQNLKDEQEQFSALETLVGQGQWSNSSM